MAWALVIVGGEGRNYGNNHKEWIISSQEDLADPEFEGNCDDSAPGSLAYTADFSVIAQKDLDGTWKIVGGDA